MLHVGLFGFFNVYGRVLPSDADSTESEQSSGRETGEETARPSTVGSAGRPRRAWKKGVLLFFFLLCALAALYSD